MTDANSKWDYASMQILNKIVSKLEKGVASWAKCKLLSSAGSMGGPELVSAQINHAFRNRDTPPRSLKRDNIRIPNNVWKVGTTWSWLILERLSTRETRYTHTYTRLYIYIYIHITWLNKILDSLTLPISLPSIEPSAFHDEILMTLSTRFDPRPIFFNPISVINSEPRYPFLD